MTRRFAVIISEIVILAIAVFVGVHFSGWQRTSPVQNEVILGGKTFVVEIANTPVLQERGLSGHAPLVDDEGMLFVFSHPDNYGFWMKDMLFPLDIIWISSDFHIIFIEKSLSPQTYPTVFYPNAPAQYVLEISAGQYDTLNIKIGDSVKIIKK